MPDWYEVLRAADRLRVPAPHLLAMPDGDVWLDIGLAAERAEIGAQNYKAEQRNKPSQKPKGAGRRR